MNYTVLTFLLFAGQFALANPAAGSRYEPNQRECSNRFTYYCACAEGGGFPDVFGYYKFDRETGEETLLRKFKEYRHGNWREDCALAMREERICRLVKQLD
jgi:hypothetical protein